MNFEKMTKTELCAYVANIEQDVEYTEMANAEEEIKIEADASALELRRQALQTSKEAIEDKAKTVSIFRALANMGDEKLSDAQFAAESAFNKLAAKSKAGGVDYDDIKKEAKTAGFDITAPIEESGEESEIEAA